MKVTLNWLKNYVDFDWSPEELKERLTLLGLEVEGMGKIGGDFEGVVVAQVITCEKHPNADKLTVCRVNDGQGERQIVCGAKNFQAGDKVPLALPGCTLAGPAGSPPFTIKVGKIRGVDSYGMMCSPKELGLAEDASGLMLLPADARVGQGFAAFLGRAGNDVVYDLEVTPNRPDLNSVIGIAREISALTGNPLKLPGITLPAGTGRVQEAVAVRIEDEEACPRYTARLIRGVKVGPSPDWLKQTLEKVGLRSISNVVDVTNYVMLECGQPLHAFDYHLLQPQAVQALPTIVIRRAGEGEKFTTLDNQERQLTSQMLVIADECRAIALAGIMGGQNSEINEKTVDVLLESAAFKPQSIRATSKKLELRSDASYRFERGSDIGICDWASQRAAQLIQETAGGQLAEGVVDAFPRPPQSKEITLRFARTDQLLGVAIPAAEQAGYLRKLELAVVREDGSSVTVRVPTWRVDLKREADLIEEAGRLYGVDQIPSTAPKCSAGANEFDAVHDQYAEVRRLLAGLGLDETQGQTLLPETGARLAGKDLVCLQNPLSSDMNVLRPSLLPGLLDALQRNLNRKNGDLALFELGRVFLPGAHGPREGHRLALALTGNRSPLFWTGTEREARLDLHDLKGLIEEFLEQIGIRGVNYVRRTEPTSLYLESAEIQLGKYLLGELGWLQPALARKLDLRDSGLLAELDLDLLLARRNPEKSFKALPAFPSIRRDVAMLVPEEVTHDAVLKLVKQARLQSLETVSLFDVFRGQNVPAGQKSLAYAFIYRHAERTLTDQEVNEAHNRLVEQFKQQLHATVRE
jgi:phenylalanyl-tRNA synthetase beta chain